MPDMHIVDPFTRETRCDGDILLFHLQDQWHEALDIRGRYIIPVGPLNQGLSCEGNWISSIVRRDREMHTFPFKSSTATVIKV